MNCKYCKEKVLKGEKHECPVNRTTYVYEDDDSDFLLGVLAADLFSDACDVVGDVVDCVTDSTDFGGCDDSGSSFDF